MVLLLVNFSKKLLVACGIQDNMPVMEMPANLLSMSSIHPFPSHFNVNNHNTLMELFCLHYLWLSCIITY